MRALFVHPNFPGQFGHLARALVARGDEVAALTMSERPPLDGVLTIRTQPKNAAQATHPWGQVGEAIAIHAASGLAGARALRDRGFEPDVILAHPSWGDAMTIRDVWPATALGIYCESWGTDDAASPFDPEFAGETDRATRRGYARLRGMGLRLAMLDADAGLSPTRFQADGFPDDFRGRITVVHEGIADDVFVSRPAAALTIDGRVLTAADEVVAFIARNLEPARGFHTFLRALPDLLRARPDAQVVIVGGDDTSYGRLEPGGWRARLWPEISGQVDPARIHFAGILARPAYLDALAIARLRVYLTYPTVVSWSMLEGMAAGVPLLASDVAPVREFVTDGYNGRLFPFHEPATLATAAAEMLADRASLQRIGAAARATVAERFTVGRCVPQQVAWLDALARRDGTANALANWSK